jgi:hypothetical protein
VAALNPSDTVPRLEIPEYALELGFRNRVEQHLPRLVNCEVDLADPANPFGRWWRGGYQLRNRVAHEGYDPEYDETKAALDDAKALDDALGQGLAADAVTRELASWLTASTHDDAAQPD